MRPHFSRIIHALVVVASLTSLLTSGNSTHKVVADQLGPTSLSDTGSIEMQAASPGNPRMLYRARSTTAGDIVESSTDGGTTWTQVLASTPPQPISGLHSGAVGPASVCRPAGYTHIRSLMVGGSGAGTLYVGTAGTPGNYLDGGCSSAAGGLYTLVGNGATVLLGSAGLPFAQDPAGRTVPTYDIDSVTPDPLTPGLIYVHAAQGTGPGSPPAGLYKTMDNGGHWTEIDTGLRSSATIINAAGVSVPVYGAGTLSIDPVNPELLTFTNDTGSYQSSNVGATWLSPGETSLAIPSSTPTAPPTPTAVPTAVAPAQFGAQALSAALPAGWAWSQLSPVTALPPGRQDAVTVWDPADKVLLVFGGSDTTEAHPLNDLWAYSPSANTWTARATAPTSRFGASAAWDPIDNVLLVFGGQTGSGSGATYKGDLWAYRPSANAWTILTTSGAVGMPAPRSHAVAVWDGTGNRLLVFGGEVSENPFQGLDDMWSFTPTGGGTGGSWLQLNANNSACTITCPQPRYASEGVWDSANSVMTIFGGQNSTQSVLSDTWSWTPFGASGTWTTVNSAGQPAGRAESSSTYDSTHGVFVVGPGLSLANGNVSDVWAYLPTQSAWQQLPVAASPTPPSRHLSQWVWDDANGVFLLFGGRVAGTQGGNDLWELAPTGPVPIPTAQPTSAITPGLDEGWAVDNSGNALVTPAQLAATTNVGAKIVRINFRLGGATDWTNAALLASYDTVINNYLAAGIKVEGLITNEAAQGGQADWTANNREVAGGNGDNAFITTAYVQNAVKPLLAHFGDRVKLWEFWNEPNAYQSCIGSVCTGGSFIYPSNFAALLVDSYAAIKEPEPTGLGLSDVTVISGGIFGHSIGGALNSTNAGQTYLKNTFTMGVTTIGSWTTFAGTHNGHYPLDGIGQHLYIDQNLLTTTTDLASYYGWLRGAVTTFETPQPTYLTEGAWSTANLPQNIQAMNLDLLFGASRFVGYVPDLTWFELQDVPSNNLYFGLTDSSLNPKQSYSRFQAQTTAPGVSATPTIPLAGTNTATKTPTSPSTSTVTATATSTPAVGGSLVGTNSVAPGAVNLTSEGTADWAHWGLSSSASFDHKASVASQVSTYTLVNGGSVSQASVPTQFSWSDGTPDGTSGGTGTAVSLAGVGQGFALSVPADLTPRTVHVYAGVYRAGATFTATLSDGSAPAYSMSTLNNLSGQTVEEYTLTYHAATAGQTLHISFTMTTNHSFGNLSLAAVTLTGGSGGAPSSTPTATPSSTPSGTATGTATPTVTATLSATATNTPTKMVTGTPSVTATRTATALVGSVTGTAPGTATPTGTPSATSTPTGTSTATPTPSATVAVGVGSLTGSAGSAPSMVNLTSEGTADWAHWGLSSSASFDHKASVASQVSTYTLVNGGSASQASVPTQFSWSDGTPDGTSGGTGTAVSLAGVGQGFALNLPADLTSRTVHIYAGVYRAGATFTATLSDGSAPAYSMSTLNNLSGQTVEEYTLTYHAATAGQTLHISFTMTTNHSFGNISLAAVTLIGGSGSAPTATPSGTATNTPTKTVTGTPSVTATRTATALVGSVTSTTTGTATAPSMQTAISTATSTATGTSTAPATPSATVAVGVGSLTGLAGTAPSAVNLTSEGMTDWTHWGLSSATSFDHKANVSAQLSNYTLVNGRTVSQASMPTQFSWSDGTPDSTSGGTGTAVSLANVGQGFVLSVPADLTPRTLHVYAGVYRAGATFTATLSDGSTAPYSMSTLNNLSGQTVEEYTLTYHAATAGQTLHISFTMTANHSFGSIFLAAVTLR